MTLRIGSLFSGMGGLDMAVSRHYDAGVVWHVEFDAAPSKVLAHHYPDVPNYGDVTAVDWTEVEPVDIITGGYPCQPFSHAGTRKGTTDERHLWPYVADALRVLRPRVAVFENVAGHLSLGFDTVLADLAEMGGYDVRWGVVSAAEAGAPHRRERVWIVATDAARQSGDWGRPAGASRWAEPANGGGDPDLTLLPTPAARDHKGPNPNERTGGVDLPTALEGVNDATSICETGPREILRSLWDEDAPQAVRAESGAGGHGSVYGSQDMRPGVWQHEEEPDQSGRAPLAGAQAPQEQLRGVRDDREAARPPHRPRPDEQRPGEPADAVRVMSPETALARGPREEDAGRNEGGCNGCRPWGKYAPAIHRWEIRLSRLAPPPTVLGDNGRPRLNARAVEFMMGLPDGWVCDVPGVSRSAQLKMLGNGVVPAQAALALSLLDGAA